MTLTLQDLGKVVLDTEYAVRGPIVLRARELELEGREIIYCNIGNPQALGQKPLTYLRQLLALCEYPALMEHAAGHFPAEVLETARGILKASPHGLGAYSESKGIKVVREAVAEFIRERDGIPADAESIYLTDGASKGVQTVLRMVVAEPTDGVLIPIPQYPLYSASITLLGAQQLGYYLDEERSFGLSLGQLEDTVAHAKAAGIRPRALCVINPGNPTGAVLDEANIRMVVDFAQRHSLTILADEVYQENVYRPEDRFVSFAKVMHAMGVTDVTLFSFHSCSKGYLGECGHRGGYLEVRNLPADVEAQLLKLQSVSLCSNLPGQVAVHAMVRPPKPGTPSGELFAKERSAILDSLKERALLLAAGLNRVDGIRCNAVAGAMYAFPEIKLPPGKTDAEYCMALLLETGICVVPGSGFGQLPGTAHFRTTILPPTAQLEQMVERLARFHAAYR